MGTCKMSASPDKGVVQETGEAWSCKGLYVADASVFPTSSGANPMITTYACAHSIAQNVKKSFSTQPARVYALASASKL